MTRKANIKSEQAPRPRPSRIEIEVLHGVEGDCLVINSYRVAGPKPWGGGTIVKTWLVEADSFRETLLERALPSEKVTNWYEWDREQSEQQKTQERQKKREEKTKKTNSKICPKCGRGIGYLTASDESPCQCKTK